MGVADLEFVVPVLDVSQSRQTFAQGDDARGHSGGCRDEQESDAREVRPGRRARSQWHAGKHRQARNEAAAVDHFSSSKRMFTKITSAAPAPRLRIRTRAARGP
jgi:hypothetical protein